MSTKVTPDPHNVVWPDPAMYAAERDRMGRMVDDINRNLKQCPTCKHFDLMGYTPTSKPIGKCDVASRRIRLAAQGKASPLPSKTNWCEEYEQAR